MSFAVTDAVSQVLASALDGVSLRQRVIESFDETFDTNFQICIGRVRAGMNHEKPKRAKFDKMPTLKPAFTSVSSGPGAGAITGANER